MYQWYETEDQNNNMNIETADHDSHIEKTYSYAKDWFEYSIDSDHFHNPLGKVNSCYHFPLYIQYYIVVT